MYLSEILPLNIRETHVQRFVELAGLTYNLYILAVDPENRSEFRQPTKILENTHFTRSLE